MCVFCLLFLGAMVLTRSFEGRVDICYLAERPDAGHLVRLDHLDGTLIVLVQDIIRWLGLVHTLRLCG